MGQDEVYGDAKDTRKEEAKIAASIVFPLQYDTIVELKDIPKDQIYVRVKEWATKYFVSQKTVLQSDDKDGGLIMYKFSNTTYKSQSMGLYKLVLKNQLDCIASIYVKDGKARMILDNFYTHLSGEDLVGSWNFRDISSSSQNLRDNFYKEIPQVYRIYGKPGRERIL